MRRNEAIYMIVIIIRYDIGHILEFKRDRKVEFLKILDFHHLMGEANLSIRYRLIYAYCKTQKPPLFKGGFNSVISSFFLS
jgi:hypothetical protein